MVEGGFQSFSDKRGMTEWESCQHMCEGGDEKQLLGEYVLFVCVCECECTRDSRIYASLTYKHAAHIYRWKAVNFNSRLALHNGV